MNKKIYRKNSIGVMGFILSWHVVPRYYSILWCVSPRFLADTLVYDIMVHHP